MTHTHRVMVTIVPLQQNRLQRTNKSNDRGLGMVPSFARSLGLLMAIGLTCIKLGDLSISPHSISQHQIVPTNLRTIPNMVKHSLPSVEVLKANGTMHMVSEVVFPYRFNLMDFKHVNCKFLTSVSFKSALSFAALEGEWLLGRAGRPPFRSAGGGKGISISKFRKLFNVTNKSLSIAPNVRRPVLERSSSMHRILRRAT